MKKILVSFATLAVISSSIMTTTAWAKNKQHIQTKDPDHQLAQDTSYRDLDFGNFQSVMHPFSFQKLDPTIADVNVNINNPVSAYNYIASQLDQRLSNYYSQFKISASTLESYIYYNVLGTNFNIIDQTTGLAWVPPTLTSGQYECYNLELVNLLSHTSFTFSLNYCNFNLNKIINPINAVPNVDNVFDPISSDSDGGYSDFFPWNSSQPYTTFDLSSYLVNVNSNATWPNSTEDKYYDYLLKIDNYFMNPITWKWNSSLKIHYYGNSGYQYDTANLFDNSDQGGYNSQINYQINQNSTDHYGLVKPVSPPLKGGGAWPRKWEANTLSQNNVHGGDASGNNGRLDEYEDDSGWASTSEMYNVWNMNGDTEHYESSDWGQNAQDMLYIDQFWSGSSNNEINLAPYIAGFSNTYDWPTGDSLAGQSSDWYLNWTFNTTEMDTSYKDLFTQASAYQVTGLEDYSTFMTYKDPNKILKNYSVPLDSSNGINEIYDLYDSAQTVTFNSNYLTSASVDYQSVALYKPYTINQGSHVIDVRFKDPQIAKEYEGNYNEGALEFHIDIQNNYDFSQGVDATTLNKTNEVDSYGDTIYNVDVYMKGKSASQLSYYIEPGQAADRLPVLKEIIDESVVDPPWQNILNPSQNLIDEIVQDGDTVSVKKQGQDSDLNSFLSGYNAISADQSILGWGGDEESSSYRTGLTNRINTMDGSISHLKGIMFHFTVSWDGGAWHCQNFNKNETIGTQYLNAYNAIVEPQLQYPPKEKPFIPSQETAQQIANKLQDQTIELDPRFWVGKDIKNYKEQLAQSIVYNGILTQSEVECVSWGNLTLNQARNYPNCDFTVNKDGQIAVAHNITLNVQDKDEKLFNQIDNLIENDIMKQEEGSIQYINTTPATAPPPYGSIDTSNKAVMQDLINSIGKDPAIMHDISDFNKQYSKYIKFDQTKVTNGGEITMHLQVGNYIVSYQDTFEVRIWWRTAS